MFFSRQLNCDFAIVAILCTIALFLFPAIHGSYSAVHGPVTALRATKSRVQNWIFSVLAVLQVLATQLNLRAAALPLFGADSSGSFRSSPLISTSVLRC